MKSAHTADFFPYFLFKYAYCCSKSLNTLSRCFILHSVVLIKHKSNKMLTINKEVLLFFGPSPEEPKCLIV